MKFLCSVAVADESLTAFNDLKLGKNTNLFYSD